MSRDLALRGQPDLLLGAGAVARTLRVAGRLGQPLQMALLAGLYYGAAKLGYQLEFAGPVAAIVWLPVGVGIAFLYLGGSGLWPGVLVGDLLANDYNALPIGTALGQTCGNVLEVLVAVALLRRLVRSGSPLATVANLGWLVLALVVGTTVSATVGCASLVLGDVVELGRTPTIWRTWWLGDFAGALVVVPLALAWAAPVRGWWRGRTVEGAVLLLAVVGWSEVLARSHGPLVYLVFPVLGLAALRFGQRGATLGVAATTLVVVWNTVHSIGPFAYHSITRSLLSTQLFIAVAALSALCLAAVVAEREEIAERLGRARGREFEAADVERRRIERNLHDGAQQRLYALAVRLRLGAERARTDPAAGPALLTEAEAELQLVVGELRELAHGIHPAVLARFGLAEAVTSLVERSAAPVEIVALPAARASASAESTAYYVIAEGLTNAQRYSAGRTIRLRVELHARRLEVEIADDGVGGANPSLGSGLDGLRDRVEGAGGRFDLSSPPGRGTRVRASIPSS